MRWKKIVKNKMIEENEKELKENMKKFKKLKKSVLIEESSGMKDYIKKLSVKEARTIFKHRCYMTRYIKMNYKGNPLYEKQLWKCNKCQKIDSEEHILWCDGYKELREGKNLDNDKDLCKYLQKIQKIREREESKKPT